MIEMDISSIDIERLPTDGHPFQSPSWAYVKKINGWKAAAFHLECAKEGLSENLLVLTKPVGLIFYIAYIPFCSDSIRELSLKEEFFYQLSRSLRRLLPSHLLFIRYDFPFFYTDENMIPTMKGLHIKECSDSVQPEATSIIDLSLGYDSVRSSYRQRARRALSRIAHSDISIIEYDNDRKKFDSWYELYRETARRDGFSTRSKEYISYLVHAPEMSDFTTLLLAFHKGVLVGGIITISSERTSVYLLGASKRIRGISPSYLLQDYSIKAACDKGSRFYDLHGVSGPFDKGEHLQSLTLFKKGFGGNIYYRQPSTDYICDSILYALYSIIERIRYRMNRKNSRRNTQQYCTTEDN